MSILRKKSEWKDEMQADNGVLQLSLGALQLMLLGVGGTIGTGIFVLTSEAAQKAGPSMVISFLLAGVVCGLAALCYAELAAMIPRAGSAYTYSYIAIGELPAWLVGWALILEYAVSASAVAVGWSGYFEGAMQGWFGFSLPAKISDGPFASGIINLPAMMIALGATLLLMLGTRESARVNTVLVVLKLATLLLFAFFAISGMRTTNFVPFAPEGWVGGHGSGILGAAASVFFTYVGFDAVSTAAEETRNPQRNVPLGLLAGLAVCMLVYLVVAAGVIGGPLGAQPLVDEASHWLQPGSVALTHSCAQFAQAESPISCSKDGLAHVMRLMNHGWIANLIGLVAFLALPSVVLVLIFGQTRIFLAMARDGLLPVALAAVHPISGAPRLLTAVTGGAVALAAGFLPIGKLADIANAGTLFAFTMVAIAAIRLRRIEPQLSRPFRIPAIGLVAAGAIFGCLALFASLPFAAQLVLPVWGTIGIIIYVAYGRRNSNLSRQPIGSGKA